MCPKACTRVLFLQFKRPSENLSDGLTNGETVTVVSLCYGYDYTGNLIHRKLPDGEVQNYFYDLHDQLVKAEIFKKDGTKETWAYTYDALGRRIGKGRLKNEEVSDGLKEETGFVWDGSHLLQDGRYTYLYTDPDSYEPLAQEHNHTNTEGESRQQILYFHCDQIGIPREMTDKDGNLLWFGNYTGWGRLKEETKVTDSAYHPFRLQNQYADLETGLHYNFFRYYEPNVGRFVNQDPIGLEGGDNLYTLMPNAIEWIDPLGLAPKAGDIKALQTGGNGTVVSVKSKADADALLKAAFPDAQKVRGIGPEDASDARRLNKRIAFKKADGKVHYHKDYAMDKATGRCKGHDDPQGTGHGKYPHINIRRPDGKQVRIDIIGK